jgi:DNA repair protein RecN (Recombination protein N)
LLKKHQVTSTQELLDMKEQLSEKIFQTKHIEDELAEAEKTQEKLYTGLTIEAKKISTARKNAAEALVQQLHTILPKIGMPNATLKIDCTSTGLNSFGADQIDFLFDANKRGRFEPLW